MERRLLSRGWSQTTADCQKSVVCPFFQPSARSRYLAACRSGPSASQASAGDVFSEHVLRKASRRSQLERDDSLLGRAKLRLVGTSESAAHGIDRISVSRGDMPSAQVSDAC